MRPSLASRASSQHPVCHVGGPRVLQGDVLKNLTAGYVSTLVPPALAHAIVYGVALSCEQGGAWGSWAAAAGLGGSVAGWAGMAVACCGTWHT